MGHGWPITSQPRRHSQSRVTLRSGNPAAFRRHGSVVERGCRSFVGTLGSPFGLAVRCTSPRTSGTSHRHVTPVRGLRHCFLNGSLRPAVPSWDAQPPLPPGLPGSVSGDADPPDLAATPGHDPRPGLNLRLLRRVTGRQLRAVGHHPPPLPSRSQVAFESGHQPHFWHQSPSRLVSSGPPSPLPGRSLRPAILSQDTLPPLRQ